MNFPILKSLLIIMFCFASQNALSQSSSADGESNSGVGTSIIETSNRNNALSLSRQQGDKRPDSQFSTMLFKRPITFGGEAEVRMDLRNNLDGDSSTDDEFRRIGEKIELEAFYEIDSRIYAFGEVKFTAQQERDEDGDSIRESGLERGESWLYYLFPNNRMALQIGRQSFRDKREWWWDNDLDAVRLHFSEGRLKGEISIAQELGGVSQDNPLDAREDAIFRVLSNVQWRWRDRQQLDLFWMQHNDNSSALDLGALVSPNDEDRFDANLNWLGFRSRGTFKIKPFGRFYYWADFGRVEGDERRYDFSDATDGQRVVDGISDLSVAGTAIDVGLTLRTKLPGELSITIGYARGSGDRDTNDARDTSFRQTGLQDNNAKFRGVDRFRYYGELFRPELSNMQIITVSLGRHIMSESSVEILYHYYEQIDAQDSIRESRLDIDPEGLNTGIGHEIDLVYGLENWTHWEVELVAAIFFSGKAFGEQSGELSYSTIAKINYNF